MVDRHRAGRHCAGRHRVGRHRVGSRWRALGGGGSGTWLASMETMRGARNEGDRGAEIRTISTEGAIMRYPAASLRLRQPGFRKRALDGYVILVPRSGPPEAAPKPRRGHDVVPLRGPPQAA
eukprot:scaffold53853_cov71-Phaeocystis_antarctica.AAC.2